MVAVCDAPPRMQSEAAHAWCDGGRACDGVAVISDTTAATHRRQSEAAHAWCDGGRACDGVAVISSDPPLMMVAAHGRGDVMVVRGPAGCRLPGPGITVYHGNIILSCQIDSTLS